MQLFPLICIMFAIAAVYSIQIPPFVLLNRARAIAAAPTPLNIQGIGQDLRMISDRISVLENQNDRSPLRSDDENLVVVVEHDSDFLNDFFPEIGFTLEEAGAFMEGFVETANPDLLDVFIFFKLLAVHRKIRRLENDVSEVSDLTHHINTAITDTIIPHLTAIKLKQDGNHEKLYHRKAALSVNTFNTNKLVSLQNRQKLFNKYMSESVRDIGRTCLSYNPFKSSTKYN